MTAPDDDLPDLDQIASGSVAVDGTTMTLAGDVDFVLVQAWERAHPEPTRVRCIDAEQVTFLGSAGIAFVLRVVKRAAPDRVQLRRPSRPARRPLQAMGVDQLLDVVE